MPPDASNVTRYLQSTDDLDDHDNLHCSPLDHSRADSQPSLPLLTFPIDLPDYDTLARNKSGSLLYRNLVFHHFRHSPLLLPSRKSLLLISPANLFLITSPCTKSEFCLPTRFETSYSFL